MSAPPFGDTKMEGAVLVHEISRFGQWPPLLDARHGTAHDVLDRNKVGRSLCSDKFLDDV